MITNLTRVAFIYPAPPDTDYNGPPMTKGPNMVGTDLLLLSQTLLDPVTP